MAGHPSVSVALCTHNGERFIGEQIESILTQTLRVDQIVVSDDNSGDATVDRAVTALRAAPPSVAVTVLRNSTPLGVTANFEAAIAACKGEVIVLSDQDDVWEPHRVHASVAALGDPLVVLVASDATLIDESGAPFGGGLWARLGLTSMERDLMSGPTPWRALMRRNVVTGATVAFRASLLNVASPFPRSWLHDEWLAMMAASQGKVALLDDRLIRYRLHGGNVVGMRERTFAVMLSRLTANGAERNTRLRMRAEDLRDRVDVLADSVDDDFGDAVRAKAAHERRRAELSKHRLRRIGPVATLARSGSYARFGMGVSDIVRDLVQPLSQPKSDQGCTGIRGR